MSIDAEGAKQATLPDQAFEIEAIELAALLRVHAWDVPQLLRRKFITAICEKGVDEDAGLVRLTFFYRSSRARVTVDAAGRILKRSAVHYPEGSVVRREAECRS
jgi:hypothetical protein